MAVTDIKRIAIDEIRGYEAARLKEAEIEHRKQLTDLRMDIYTAKTANASKFRTLKRNLARIMSVKTERRKATPVTAPKAAKTVTAKAKAPKAKAAKAEKTAKPASKKGK